jgi:hypothetical protein
MTNEFNIGDNVYWRYRIGMFSRTRSGRITSITGETASVAYHSQNASGVKNISLSKLTKNKIQ